MEQRIAVIGTGFRPTGGNIPPEEIAHIVSDGFAAELVEIPDGIFPADPLARDIVDRQYLEAGRRSADAGFDAVYINTVGDYGLAEMRDALEVPVIGSGETAYRYAAELGKFSIVTIWPPSLDFIRQRVLDQSGTRDACLDVRFLSNDDDMNTLEDDDNFVTDMRSCRVTSLARIEDARDTAIEAGAKAVVLGCTCMAPAAAMLPPNNDGETIDPMTLGYRFAEYCLTNHVRPEWADYSHVKGWMTR